MYTPDAFRIDDHFEQMRVIEDYPFASLITSVDSNIVTSHIPLLSEVRNGNLILQGHFAKVNPHSTVFSDNKTLVIFKGPDCYISPLWYENSHEVPTWNYISVHCEGVGKILSDKKWLNSFFTRFTEKLEPAKNGWSYNSNENYIEKLLPHIVGFEIQVSQINAKFKISQNRSSQDQVNVINALEGLGSEKASEMAAVMRKNIQSK